jgi:stage III sporulation protein AG
MNGKGEKGIFSKFKNGGRLWLIVMCGFLGITLLLYGGTEDKKKEVEEDDRLTAYAERVEEKLTELCSKVEGVKNVSVAVSFESGFEYVYATDGDKTLTVGNGASESAVRVTEKPPAISGVGVVCSGGGSPSVQKRLIELISAAYGISSNKIYITEAQK